MVVIGKAQEYIDFAIGLSLIQGINVGQPRAQIIEIGFGLLPLCPAKNRDRADLSPSAVSTVV